MRNISIAFMAKLGWRLIPETKDLWARVLQGKVVKGKTDEEANFFKCLARHCDWCRCNKKRQKI